MPRLLRALISAIRSIKPKLSESEPLHCKENLSKLEHQKKSTRKFCQDLLQACSCVRCSKNRYSAKKFKACCCDKRAGRQSSSGMLAHCDDSHLHHNNRRPDKNPFCCCGNRPGHVTCTRRPASSTARHAGGVGAKNKNTKDIFSKYDRQSVMTHRQDSPISQTIYTPPVPVNMPPLVPRRWPQSGNIEGSSRSSTESSCCKPPPNRTVLSNDRFLITSLNRGKILVSNEVDPYLSKLDHKLTTGHHDRKNISKCMQKNSPNFLPPDGAHHLRAADNRHLPSFESLELLRGDDAFSSSDSVSINGDPPPEYSEPPGYYSNA